MISMIWISQAALRFADTDFFAIFVGFIFMLIVFSWKNDDESVTRLFLYLMLGLLSVCTKYLKWNEKSLPQDERITGKDKKENKKRENSPPAVGSSKKRQKKGKKSPNKTLSKENKAPANQVIFNDNDFPPLGLGRGAAKNSQKQEPSPTKKETKMYQSLDVCGKLNRDAESIYNYLHQHILTDSQLRMNCFPHEGFQPRTEVAATNSDRHCVRCGEAFTIANGVYLCHSACQYHPKKVSYSPASSAWVHGCCNAPSGSPGCASWHKHVTLQHRPRALTRASSRRHIRKDLRHAIYSLDCEMSYTTDGLEVVRVGLVNIDGHAVYDGYVVPKNQILDYNTQFSGVDNSHLKNVTVTIDDVKNILSSYIHEDTILVGHALNNDLAALGLIHNTIVDTSVLYADPVNPRKKIALKTLAATYLGLKIQDGPTGHDCIDDARATLQLALLKVPPLQSQPISRPLPVSHQTGNSSPLPLGEIQNFNSSPSEYHIIVPKDRIHVYNYNGLWIPRQQLRRGVC